MLPHDGGEEADGTVRGKNRESSRFTPVGEPGDDPRQLANSLSEPGLEAGRERHRLGRSPQGRGQTPPPPRLRVGDQAAGEKLGAVGKDDRLGPVG